jgi:hypothetical protein
MYRCFSNVTRYQCHRRKQRKTVDFGEKIEMAGLVSRAGMDHVNPEQVVIIRGVLPRPNWGNALMPVDG